MPDSLHTVVQPIVATMASQNLAYFFGLDRTFPDGSSFRNGSAGNCYRWSCNSWCNEKKGMMFFPAV